jgi:hypothetical protein
MEKKISNLEIYNDLMELLNAAPYERDKIFDEKISKYLSLIDREKLKEAYAKKMDLVPLLFKELNIEDITGMKPYIIRVGIISVNVTAVLRKILRVYWKQFVNRFCNNETLQKIFAQLLPDMKEKIMNDHQYFIKQAIENYLVAGVFAFPEKKEEIINRAKMPSIRYISRS